MRVWSHPISGLIAGIGVLSGAATIDAQEPSVSEASARFGFEELLRIGSADSNAVEHPERFFRVSGGTTDRSGNIYVLDGGHGRIQVFGPNGAFVRTIGFGVGPNPGRFMDPVDLVWLELDSVLGILDRYNNTATIFRVGGEFVDRVPLSHGLLFPSAVARTADGITLLSAFSSRDSTTLHFLTPTLTRTRSEVRWPRDRLPLLLRRFGGAEIVYQSSLGFIVARWNPGALAVYGEDGEHRYELELSSYVPPGDSLVLALGPAGEWMVGSSQVRMVTGVAAVEDSTVVVSTSLGSRLGAELLLIDIRQGVVGTWETRDPMIVLGSAGDGRILLWQDVGGEFVSVYQVAVR